MSETSFNAEPKVLKALGDLESRFRAAEDEVLRKQVALYKPLYEERDPLVNQIPGFWASIMSEIPELDELLNMEDTALMDHLKTLTVVRDDAKPRNFTISMTFEENEFLDASSLTLRKDFTQASSDGPGDLASKPTAIKWKKDLTKQTQGGRPSFFQFFSWTGSEDDVLDQGEEIALMIADEIYPDAVKLWTDAQDVDDEEEGDSDPGSEDIQSANDDEEEEAEQAEEGPQKKKTKTV